MSYRVDAENEKLGVLPASYTDAAHERLAAMMRVNDALAKDVADLVDVNETLKGLVAERDAEIADFRTSQAEWAKGYAEERGRANRMKIERDQLLFERRATKPKHTMTGSADRHCLDCGSMDHVTYWDTISGSPALCTSCGRARLKGPKRKRGLIRRVAAALLPFLSGGASVATAFYLLRGF